MKVYSINRKKKVKAGLETLQRCREHQQRRGCGHRAACTSLSVLRNDEGATFLFAATCGSRLHLCTRSPPQCTSLHQQLGFLCQLKLQNCVTTAAFWKENFHQLPFSTVWWVFFFSQPLIRYSQKHHTEHTKSHSKQTICTEIDLRMDPVSLDLLLKTFWTLLCLSPFLFGSATSTFIGLCGQWQSWQTPNPHNPTFHTKNK